MWIVWHPFFLQLASALSPSFNINTYSMLRTLPLLPGKESLAWILEGRMKTALEPPVGVALLVEELLENQHLVFRHVGIVTPPLLFVMLEHELWLGPARGGDAMNLRLDDVLIVDGGAVEHAEGIVEQHAATEVDWAPETDNHEDLALCQLLVDLR